MIEAYDVKFIFAFLIFDILVNLFEAARKSTPTLFCRAVPYQNVPQVRHGCY